MELIERYLQAVEFWLPKAQRQDIIAELSEDIRAQVEERESELGRSLNEQEAEALLKRLGAPLIVANRYLPQRHLIGPLLFPIYLFVLKIVGMYYLIPWLLVWVGLSLYGPGDPVTHSHGINAGALWKAFCTTVFINVGLVTLVFAILEQVHAKRPFLSNWNPRKLPPVRQPDRIARSSSGLEVAINMLFYTWWASHMISPLTFGRFGVQATLTPLWPYFYWGTLALTLLNGGLAAVNLIRPYQTRPRAAMRLFNNAAGSVLFCWMLKVNVLTGLTVANLSAERAQQLVQSFNWWLDKMFPGAVIACVVLAVVDIVRVVRVRTRQHATAPAVQLSAL